MKAEWSFVVDIAQSCGVPEAQCEDIAVEVFLRLERHFESMSSSEPPVIRAWLRTTTVHIAQEQPYLRSMTSVRVLATRPGAPADPDLMDPATIVPTPEDQLMAAQTQGTLRSLVETLEPNRREVFVLHVVEEEPMHEVARRLGIPEATAYNRLRLAREDLREILMRAWRADERKPGGRSFAVVPSLLGLPPEALKQLPREMWEALSRDVVQSLPRDVVQSLPRDVVQSLPRDVVQSLPRDVVQSLPRDVVQSLPRDVVQSLPRDVVQSLPRDVHRSISLAAQSAVEVLSQCVSAAAFAGGAALVAGAAITPGKPAVELAELAPPAKAHLIVATEGPSSTTARSDIAEAAPAHSVFAEAHEREVTGHPQGAGAEDPQGAVLREGQRPAVDPAQRPAVDPAQRPAVDPAQRPAAAPTPRPAAAPAQRPAVGPAPRPAAASTQRPAVGPAQRPAVGPAPRPAAPPAHWRPQLLLQLAASALHRGDAREAAAVLQMYRAEYPEDPLADEHREVRSQLLRSR